MKNKITSNKISMKNLIFYSFFIQKKYLCKIKHTCVSAGSSKSCISWKSGDSDRILWRANFFFGFFPLPPPPETGSGGCNVTDSLRGVLTGLGGSALPDGGTYMI